MNDYELNGLKIWASQLINIAKDKVLQDMLIEKSNLTAKEFADRVGIEAEDMAQRLLRTRTNIVKTINLVEVGVTQSKLPGVR